MANFIYDNKICPYLFENTTFRVVFYLEIDWILKYDIKNFGIFQFNRNLNVTPSPQKRANSVKSFSLSLKLLEVLS
jgi:hypothetical protein